MSIIKKIRGVYHQLVTRKREPLRLEFVVTDYCNLNCRGCTHYSPLAAKEFEPLDRLERNMAHLAKACGKGVASAYLIGGETLLYPDLIPAMEALRRHFATQRLFIFTNGLALPRMTDDFWEAARRLGFVIALTRYPIKFDYDAAEQLCRDRGVEVEVFGDRGNEGSFFRFALDPEGRQNPHMAHLKCYNFGCISVIGDRIYPCSISGCIGHLNKACGTSFEHRKGDWLDVAGVTSARQIKQLRDRPVPFCRYCKLPPATVPYGPSKREQKEWVD